MSQNETENGNTAERPGSPYADIIDLPRPVSGKHPPMPLISRAAQFAPFSALSGFDAVIEEESRRTEEKIRNSDRSYCENEAG